MKTRMMFRKHLYKMCRNIALFPSAHLINLYKKNGLLEIGQGSYGQPIIDQYRGSESKVTIGKYTSIAPNVRIIAGGYHPTNTISQYPFRSQFDLPGRYEDGNPYSKGDVNIGSDVWIATNVTILAGVTIGDGAIIGAGSLITGEIPPYAVANGVPATTKKFRFSQEQISKLLRIRWWNWPQERILAKVSQLTSEDVDSFLDQNH